MSPGAGRARRLRPGRAGPRPRVATPAPPCLRPPPPSIASGRRHPRPVRPGGRHYPAQRLGFPPPPIPWPPPPVVMPPPPEPVPVDELEKTISVASRDPAYYGLDEVELSRRRNWIGSARNQVGTVRRAVEKGKSNSAASKYQDTSRTNLYSAQDNDDFISSESDRQLLFMRQQDEELDELSESVQRIGGVGLTIHEELSGQERILNDLSLEMETTSNRRFRAEKSCHGAFCGAEKSCHGDEESRHQGSDYALYWSIIFQWHNHSILQGSDYALYWSIIFQWHNHSILLETKAMC